MEILDWELENFKRVAEEEELLKSSQYMLKQRPPPSAATSQEGTSKGRGWGVSHQCLDRN